MFNEFPVASTHTVASLFNAILLPHMTTRLVSNVDLSKLGWVALFSRNKRETVIAYAITMFDGDVEL